MGEKVVAGIVTAAAIAPICAVCILGPAAVGSLFAGALEHDSVSHRGPFRKESEPDEPLARASRRIRQP